MSSNTSVIVAGARTGMGRLLGSLKDFSATDLGGVAIKGALEKAGISGDQVDYVVMGHVLQAGCGQVTARQAAVKGGIPMDVPAITVNKVCLSGINAITMADQLIRSGECEVVVAGGMESMTNAPHLLEKSREGYKYGTVKMRDHMDYDALWDVYTDQGMGNLTESANHGDREFSREEQDAFSARSHELSAKAWKDGLFDDEVVPVLIPQRKGDPIEFKADEGIRAATTAESLAGLRPAFRKDGTITAGSASQISDGAGAVLLMTRAKAEALGLTPRARVVDTCLVGTDPVLMLTGPIDATHHLLERNGMTIGDIDVTEINEAFASVVLSWERELQPDDATVNPNGGAIALGHPLGASGAILVTKALHELERTDKSTALVTMCCGGGLGTGTIIERI